MLKTESKEKLFRIATNNIYFGGASALVIAKRMKDSEGLEIVGDVYSRSSVQENPYTAKECEWCGCEYIPAETDHEGFCGQDCAESYYN